MAFWLVTGAATGPQFVADRLGGTTESGAGFITKEWTWRTGATTQSFTAHGPSEQVDRLDPHDATPDCPNCQLASSIRFVSGGG